MTIEIPIKKLKSFFSERKEINTAIVFGSFAKGRMHADSDIDIAILLRRKIPDVFDHQAKLSIDLEHLMGREVDVIILNTASPHLAFRATREGKIIYQRDQRIWSQFIVRNLRENEDMEILYRKVSRG